MLTKGEKNGNIDNQLGYQSTCDNFFSTCGHVFHYECLNRERTRSWNSVSTCPYCSTDYDAVMPVFSYQKLIDLKSAESEVCDEVSFDDQLKELMKDKFQSLERYEYKKEEEIGRAHV